MSNVWMELRTPTLSASTTFYENSFGWTTVSQPIGPTTYFRFVDSQSQYRAGMVEVSSLPQPTWVGYIWVDEPDSIITNAISEGGTLLTQGSNHPLKGDWAILRDSGGGVFGVYNGDPFQ